MHHQLFVKTASGIQRRTGTVYAAWAAGRIGLTDFTAPFIAGDVMEIINRTPVPSDVIPVLDLLCRKEENNRHTGSRFWFALKGYLFGYMRGVHDQRHRINQNARALPVQLLNVSIDERDAVIDRAINRYCEALSVLPESSRALLAVAKLIEDVRAGRTDEAAYTSFLEDLPKETKEEHLAAIRRFASDILAEG